MAFGPRRRAHERRGAGGAVEKGGAVKGCILTFLLVLSACSGIDFGDRTGHEFPKETGPLTVPSASVWNGTAR